MALQYDVRLRPAQPPTPAPDAFAVHRTAVAATPGRDGLEIAYIREGVGGYPLLLVHGYPETKRIWWRNIRPLAEAGYEVIVPDLRGYGDSDLSAADVYDLAAYSRDLHQLVRGLGHEHCGVVAGDVGAAVAVDLVHRFPGFVDKLVYFDTSPPMIIDEYIAAGIDPAAIQQHHGRPDRRLPAPPRRNSRRARGRARHGGPAAALHRRDVRAPPVGIPGHLRPGGHRVHDRAVRDGRTPARKLGGLPTGLRPSPPVSRRSCRAR
ncbi:alpha/beta fold hydrolase [Yinghuangia aomiensis]